MYGISTTFLEQRGDSGIYSCVDIWITRRRAVFRRHTANQIPDLSRALRAAVSNPRNQSGDTQGGGGLKWRLGWILIISRGLARKKDARPPLAPLGSAHICGRRYPRPSRPPGRLGRANPRRPRFRAAGGHDDFPGRLCRSGTGVGRRPRPPEPGRFPDADLRLARQSRGCRHEISRRRNRPGSWRGFGGIATLRSYGVDVTEPIRGGGYGVARKSLLARMPPEHRLFLERTHFAASLGDYFFCHAGVRPGVAPQCQNPTDLLWIREEFLRHKGSWGQIIVHGHRPSRARKSCQIGLTSTPGRSRPRSSPRWCSKAGNGGF